MKFKGMRYFLLVVGCLALLTSSCTCADVSTTPPPEMVEFVAEQIMLDDDRTTYVSLEGSVIAHVTADGRLGDFDTRHSPLRAWRYEQEQLVDVDVEVFVQALRGPDPPLRKTAFKFVSLTSDQVEVDIVYEYGRVPGGRAEIWKFEKQREEWVILEKGIPYIYWD